jgi:UDP-N-acetylglucosamine 2-epimerase (non-hydrolysing)
MKIFLVAGARPNFMKIAPLFRASRKQKKLVCRLIHTGQHYDYEMSQAFFEDLDLPVPDYFLKTGSGSHAVQTAKIMTSFEELCLKDRPDMVLLVGDVNSTLACSVVAKKMKIDVAHVEAGLRSHDMAMPEEINRIVTDALSDYYFVTEKSGRKNLIKEGKPKERIHLVGNVMIDNLFFQIKKLKENSPKNDLLKIKNKIKEFAFLTLHRPSNVDDYDVLSQITEALNQISEELPIFFPVHPRTKKMIDKFKIKFSSHIHCMEPLGFRDSLFLWKDAKIVMTDSGGLQEETTALNVPCMTIRDNTERPITIQLGTNILAGTSKQSILKAYKELINTKKSGPTELPLWDGKAAERIWSILLSDLENQS